jgi:2-dehydro-3-deoxygluconokinase
MVTFGEIMLRLSLPGRHRLSHARSPEVILGGGEANEESALAWFVARLPANDLREDCLQFLHQHGIKAGQIPRGGERLGIHCLVDGAAHLGSKVTRDRIGSFSATLQPGVFDWSAGAGLDPERPDPAGRALKEGSCKKGTETSTSAPCRRMPSRRRSSSACST